MLDIQFIRENTGSVKQAAKNKNVDVDIDKLLKLDEQRRSLSAKTDELRHQRNELSDATKKPSADDIATAKNVKAELSRLEDQLKKVEVEYSELLYKVPNIPSDDTPVGKDETANKVLRQWGKPPKLDFKPKPHWELGKQLGIIDSESAAKVAGSRFAYLKGRLVKLQFALINYALDVLTDEQTLEKIIKQFKVKSVVKPFVPVLPPAVARTDVYQATGRLNREQQTYKLADDDLWLNASAEHTLAPMHMGEMLPEASLPLRYVGYTTAFRREAGSYGQDVRGILRQHQFDKLEMESFSTIEAAEAEQDLMVAIQEHLMQSLEIPYQIIAISTGDMGGPDFRQLDLEAWMPSQAKYRETHTADWVSDYQSRSLNIKYADKSGNKQFVHMNDATVFAMGRTMIAIMENYQTKEGKIKIPDALKGYMKGSYL